MKIFGMLMCIVVLMGAALGQKSPLTKTGVMAELTEVSAAEACPTRDLKRVQQEKMQVFDAATKLEIWHKSINLQKGAPDITLAQKVLIDRAMAATLDNPGFAQREPQPGFYDTKEGLSLLAIMKEVNDQFSGAQRAAIFLTVASEVMDAYVPPLLGGNPPASLNNNLVARVESKPNCECYFAFTDCPNWAGSCVVINGNCNTVPADCGFWWTETCVGMCRG